MAAIALVCLKIFLCRILDVSLMTVRTILTVKEKSFFASLVGFLEVFIWYVVVREALATTGPVLPIAVSYAGGFACGTYVGSKIAKKFIRGNEVIQVVTTGKNDELVKELRSRGYGVSVVDVKPSEFSDEKYMLFVEVQKNAVGKTYSLINKLDPKAFIIIQETKHVINGYKRK